jgi:hypothetical protein
MFEAIIAMPAQKMWMRPFRFFMCIAKTALPIRQKFPLLNSEENFGDRDLLGFGDCRIDWSIFDTFRETADTAEAVVKEIVAVGGKAVAIKVDVSMPDDVAALFDATEFKLGKVTLLVNNAGIMKFAPSLGRVLTLGRAVAEGEDRRSGALGEFVPKARPHDLSSRLAFAKPRSVG